MTQTQAQGRHPVGAANQDPPRPQAQRLATEAMRRVLPYTDLSWNLSFKVAPFLGDLKTEILQADQMIDGLRAKR